MYRCTYTGRDQENRRETCVHQPTMCTFATYTVSKHGVHGEMKKKMIEDFLNCKDVKWVKLLIYIYKKKIKRDLENKTDT